MRQRLSGQALAAGRLLLILLTLTLLLSACRNETQNRIRRNIQDFTSATMYITLYSWDGTAIYTGEVDGKVTRSGVTESNGTQEVTGGYIYWYDERGVYHQTDLPYLVTSRPSDQPSAVPDSTPSSTPDNTPETASEEPDTTSE